MLQGEVQKRGPDCGIQSVFHGARCYLIDAKSQVQPSVLLPEFTLFAKVPDSHLEQTP